MNLFIYVTLYTTMLIALYYAGKSIKRTGKLFCKGSLIGIAVFSINEGLRYGRGVDYNVYAEVFYSKSLFKFTDWEPLFKAFLEPFIQTGMSWQWPVFIMSLSLIIGAICFLSFDRDSLPYSLPIFAIISKEAENLMRWHFAYTFILLGLFYAIRIYSKNQKFERKDIFIYLLFCFIAFNIHKPMAVVGILFLLMFFVKKPLLKPVVSIIIFFAIAFTFSTKYLENLMWLVNASVSFLGDRYSNYSDSIYFLTGGFGGQERSAFPNFTTLIVWIVGLYFGYSSKRNHILSERIYNFSYNLFTIAFITWPICNQVEILYRINLTFYYPFAMIAGKVLFNTLSKKIHVPNLYKLTIILVFSYFMFVQYKWIFSQEKYMMLYVWDKPAHEKYLDNSLYWTRDQDFSGKNN